MRIWLKRWRIKLKPCAPLVKVTDGSYEPDRHKGIDILIDIKEFGDYLNRYTTKSQN